MCAFGGAQQYSTPTSLRDAPSPMPASHDLRMLAFFQLSLPVPICSPMWSCLMTRIPADVAPPKRWSHSAEPCGGPPLAKSYASRYGDVAVHFPLCPQIETPRPGGLFAASILVKFATPRGKVLAPFGPTHAGVSSHSDAPP